MSIQCYGLLMPLLLRASIFYLCSGTLLSSCLRLSTAHILSLHFLYSHFMNFALRSILYKANVCERDRENHIIQWVYAHIKTPMSFVLIDHSNSETEYNPVYCDNIKCIQMKFILLCSLAPIHGHLSHKEKITQDEYKIGKFIFPFLQWF